jgi:multidrug efflux system membrane fusion protein
MSQGLVVSREAQATAARLLQRGACLKVWGLGAVTVAIVLVLAWPHWRGSRTPPRLPHRRQLRPRCRCALLWSPKDMPVVVTGIGSVVPAASVVIRTRVDGQLDQVAFKEGQDVKAGQVLARLDARTYQAQLQQVQAQKAKDEALLANAQADLQRYNELIRDEATTRQTLETQNHWYASCKPRCKTMQPR